VMYGPGTTTVRGGMTLASPRSYTINPLDYTQGLIGRTLVNESTALCDSCLIYADQGAVLQNTPSGTFRVTRDSAFARCTVHGFAEFGQVMYECVNTGAPPVFRNEGALVIAGPGILYFSAVPNVPTRPDIQAARPSPAQLINSGTVQVEGGGLNTAGGYTQTDGSLDLRGGSVAGSAFDIQSGKLVGTGTISGTVVNAGTVQPGGGGAASTLAIAGAYRQTAAGRLEIELGGLIPGTQFDRLTVSGQATLDGVLAVSSINGFVPASSTSFVVLAYGARSGSFASVSGGGMNYALNYGTQAAELSAP
jgi:hypothetical protein